MDEKLSDWLVGTGVAVLGLAGITLAAGARDVEMSVFGYGLSAFALAFDLNVMRRRLNEADAAHAAAGVAQHA